MKPVKLTQSQLRQIVKEVASKRLSEAPLPDSDHFEIQDLPYVVEQDNDVMDATTSLVEALVYFCEQLAVKENLVPAAKSHEVSDMLMPEADSAIRDAIYDFIKNALDSVSDMKKRGEFA